MGLSLSRLRELCFVNCTCYLGREKNTKDQILFRQINVLSQQLTALSVYPEVRIIFSYEEHLGPFPLILPALKALSVARDSLTCGPVNRTLSSTILPPLISRITLWSMRADG